MATTIAAYQQISAPFSLDQNNGTESVNWDPSDDIVRDGDRGNNCVLMWAFRPIGNGGASVRILLRGEAAEPAEIEEIRLGATPGSMITVFLSNRATKGRNEFEFIRDSGAVQISDVTVLYKRQPSGLQ